MYAKILQHTPLKQFVDIFNGDTNLIDTREFNPITPLESKNTNQIRFCRKTKYPDEQFVQHSSNLYNSFLNKYLKFANGRMYEIKRIE